MVGVISAGFAEHASVESCRSPSLSPGTKNMLSPAASTNKRVNDTHIPSPDHAVSVSSSEHFEKSGLVAAQEAALHDSAVLEMGYQMTESEYAFMPEGAILKAPSIGSLKDLRALKPIRLRNLKVGKVHRGRILSGTLCCKSVKTSAVMNVLEEDGTGDATRLMIANAVPRSATTAKAQRLYPEGAQLSVREPYLKRFSDGIVGLLVENPADIIFNYLPEEVPSPENEKEVFRKPFSELRHSAAGEGKGQETSNGQPGSDDGGFSPLHIPVSAKSAEDSDGYQRSFLADSREDHNDDEEDDEDGTTDFTETPSDEVLEEAGDLHPRKSSSVGVSAISVYEEHLQVLNKEKGAEEGSSVSEDGSESGRSEIVIEPEMDDVNDSAGLPTSTEGHSQHGDDCLPNGAMVMDKGLEHSYSEAGIYVESVENRSADSHSGDLDEVAAVGVAAESEEMFEAPENILPTKLEVMPELQVKCAEAKEITQESGEVGSETVDGSCETTDTLEAQIELIKSVVEESLEASPEAQVESENSKGMPESSDVESPKANGGTEGGRSPSSESSVEKGVICVGSKVSNKGGANDAISDINHLSAAALRLLGNKHFSRQDWPGAIDLYSRAILKAVQESKENTSPNREKSDDQPFNDEPESEVVMDYSNRAEAWLRLHHYERAWADAERALSLDPDHLKSLFRKGRALLGVGDYQQALAHLEAAYARAPFDKDLLAAIQLSRIGDHQSRLGIYELRDYYLRGRFVGEIPTCADYVGPVQVKAASGEKGRGLFLTKAVEAGDLLLVSNPLAMLESKSGTKGPKNVLDSAGKSSLRLDADVEERLVHSVRERAKVSSKNRQRLLSLCHGEGSISVPSMDLFIPGRRIAPMETPELDEARIHRIIVRNAIDRNMVSTTLEKRPNFHREVSEDTCDDRSFYGLWVLPSFINHSCIPNVSLVVLGRALFVYASRNLSAGEEILCSYSNIFQPLPQRRQLASKCWGFSCRCARCLLETRFESSLKRLYSLHSRLEPNPTFVLQFSPFGYKAPAKDLAKELEIIETSKKLDNRERSWLQASFTQLYTVSRDFMGPHGNHSYLETALRAMELVCPGSNSTLEVGLLARETVRKEFNGRKTSQYKAVNQQVLRICQCIYGKQKTVVLQSLVDGTPGDTLKKA